MNALCWQEDWNPASRLPTRFTIEQPTPEAKQTFFMIPADESHVRASDVHPHADANGPLGATPRAGAADNVAPAISNEDGATTPGGPVMVTTLVVVGGLVWYRRRRRGRAG